MRIGRVAELTGTTAATIRFYEREGLLPEPERRSSGYREYTEDIVDRLTFIRRAQEAGLALRDVKDILAIHDSGQPPCGHVQAVLTERLDAIRRQMRDLEGMQSHLQSLLERARHESADRQADAAVCWILETPQR